MQAYNKASLVKWLRESNHWKHLIVGVLIALFADNMTDINILIMRQINYIIIHCSATKTERYFHVRTQNYKT